MSFRRHSDHAGATAWRQWLLRARSDLEQIGLPLAVYETSERWDDFLENGHLHWHSEGPRFDFTELPPERMHQLRLLLERDFGQAPPPLLRFLRVRSGNEP